MHSHRLALVVLQLVGRQALAALDRVGEHRADLVVEQLAARLVETGRRGERAHLRRVQDLVAVGIADARDDPLVTQHTLELGSPSGVQDRVEGLAGEFRRQRIGAEGSDHLDVMRIVGEPDRQPALGARLGEIESGVVVEGEPEAEWALARPSGGRGLFGFPFQPAGPREVDDQVHALRVDIEHLAVPGDAADLEADQRAEWGFVGLQSGEVGQLDAGDRAGGQLGVQPTS